MKLRVPRSLVSSYEALAARWFASHTMRVPVLEEEPKKPAETGRVSRETTPALIAYREQQAREYPETVSATALAVVGLTGCKYVIGDPGDAMAFCNAPKKHGSSYCEVHHRCCTVGK